VDRPLGVVIRSIRLVDPGDIDEVRIRADEGIGRTGPEDGPFVLSFAALVLDTPIEVRNTLANSRTRSHDWAETVSAP
jgi:hypothetical protein